MSKVDLAKKTAKLMVEKLSPQELENELYQLLVLLSDDDLDYAYDDISRGDIAGPPSDYTPMSASNFEEELDDMEEAGVIINNPQDTEEYLRTSTYVEGDEKKPTFQLDDFVYAYEPGLDRWLPYTIHNIIGDNKYELEEMLVGAPSSYSGKIIEFEDYGGELKKQPEDKVFLVQDYLYANSGKDFEDFVKKSDLVKDVYIDSMSGTVDLEWNDPTMKGYITQATPFWNEPDEIPVQVTTEEGVLIDGSGVLEYEDLNVRFKPTPEFDIDNAVYPNDPDDFYRAYVSALPKILKISKQIVDIYEDYQSEQED